jgi:hypothetical protein
MKLAEFHALCGREWEKKDRGGRGDVVSICLTEAGREELVRDVLVSAEPLSILLRIDKSGLPAIAAGAGITSVANPVTRTDVRIRTKKTGRRETARVCVMGGTYRQTWWPATGR